MLNSVTLICGDENKTNINVRAHSRFSEPQRCKTGRVENNCYNHYAFLSLCALYVVCLLEREYTTVYDMRLP